MKAILLIVSICILAVGLLAYVKFAAIYTKNKADSKDTSSTGGTTATNTTKTNTQAAEQSEINKAFDQVVQVLHAPYENDDMLFRYVTGDAEINDSKKGSDSKIGTGTDIGNGTWTVTSEYPISDQNNSIVYEYTNYQPNGSTISVNGRITAMYRSQTSGAVPVYSIRFNQKASDTIYKPLQTNDNLIALVNASEAASLKYYNTAEYANVNAEGLAIYMAATDDEITQASNRLEIAFDAAQATDAYTIFTATATAYDKAEKAFISNAKAANAGELIDTLTITGAYQARLTFTYKDYSMKYLPIALTDYQQFLMNDLFTDTEGEVTFTYKNHIMTLDQVQLQKLLRVSQD